jgi:hypothetical protein
VVARHRLQPDGRPVFLLRKARALAQRRGRIFDRRILETITSATPAATSISVPGSGSGCTGGSVGGKTGKGGGKTGTRGGSTTPGVSAVPGGGQAPGSGIIPKPPEIGSCQLGAVGSELSLGGAAGGSHGFGPSGLGPTGLGPSGFGQKGAKAITNLGAAALALDPAQTGQDRAAGCLGYSRAAP